MLVSFLSYESLIEKIEKNSLIIVITNKRFLLFINLKEKVTDMYYKDVNKSSGCYYNYNDDIWTHSLMLTLVKQI